LSDADRSRELIANVKVAASGLAWIRAAESMRDVYEHAVHAPNRDIAALADERVPTTLEKPRESEAQSCSMSNRSSTARFSR
jgi:hypothetical protein